MAMVFMLVDAAQQWITDNIHVQERGKQIDTDQSNQVRHIHRAQKHSALT